MIPWVCVVDLLAHVGVRSLNAPVPMILIVIWRLCRMCGSREIPLALKTVCTAFFPPPLNSVKHSQKLLYANVLREIIIIIFFVTNAGPYVPAITWYECNTSLSLSTNSTGFPIALKNNDGWLYQNVDFFEDNPTCSGNLKYYIDRYWVCYFTVTYPSGEEFTKYIIVEQLLAVSDVTAPDFKPHAPIESVMNREQLLAVFSPQSIYNSTTDACGSLGTLSITWKVSLNDPESANQGDIDPALLDAIDYYIADYTLLVIQLYLVDSCGNTNSLQFNVIYSPPLGACCASNGCFNNNTQRECYTRAAYAWLEGEECGMTCTYIVLLI